MKNLTNQYIETSLGNIKGTDENVPTTVIVDNNSVEVHIKGEQSPKCYELINGALVDNLGYNWHDLDKFLGL
ncbi:MAG: hypothetical protein ACRCTZ_21185 [Sarcina sp.]